MLTTATELAALQRAAAGNAPQPLPCGIATEIPLIDWAAARLGADTLNVQTFAAWLADESCVCWLPLPGQ